MVHHCIIFVKYLPLANPVPYYFDYACPDCH